MLLWDGYGLQSTYSGIGRHALELAHALEKHGTRPTIIPSVNELDRAFIAWQAPIPSFPLSRVKPLALLASGLQAKSLMNSKSFSKAIFHGLSNYNLPVLPKSFTKILTVHDLIPFLFPEGVSKSLHRYLKYQMPKALDRADAIICVSEWTALSVKNQFPFAKDKVVVLPNGKSPSRPKNLNRKEGVIRLLSVSRGEIYKRLPLLSETSKLLPSNFEWHLVTDAKGAKALERNPRIFVHQKLGDVELLKLWSDTDIFVHASLWEGYCLPAADAVSFKIPSVYAGGSGIDEVIGDGGIGLPSAADADDWANAIRSIAGDPRKFEAKVDARHAVLPDWLEVAGRLKSIYDNMG